MNDTFLLAPFTTTDLLLQGGISGVLDGLLSTMVDAVAGPFLAVVALWIIVQGALVMRGDIDARRGVISLIRVSIVSGLVATTAAYNAYIGDFFSNGLFTWVDGLVTKSGGYELRSIPAMLDLVAGSTQEFVSYIAPKALAGDDPTLSSLNSASSYLYIGLWIAFTVYEFASIFLRLLAAIGPLILVGYLFDVTRGITVRWVTQMLAYGLILLLFGVVASVVINIEEATLAAQFLLMMATGTFGNVPGQTGELTTPARIYMLYEMDILIATGNALIIALPTTVATLVGGTFSPGGTPPPLASGGGRAGGPVAAGAANA